MNLRAAMSTLVRPGWDCWPTEGADAGLAAETVAAAAEIVAPVGAIKDVMRAAAMRRVLFLPVLLKSSSWFLLSRCERAVVGGTGAPSPSRIGQTRTSLTSASLSGQ